MADKLVCANDVEVLIDPVGMPERRRQEMSLETFRKLEDEIEVEAAAVVVGIAAFAQVTPDQVEPPQEWIEELGYRDAETKLRIAKAAWMCQSEAPVGLKLAAQAYIGIRRVKAGDKQVNNTLNYTVVELPVAPPQFPEKEIEGRK